MPKTILLADDSVTIQKVVGISFANEDVVLLTVDNGDDAVTQARESRPDIVLADIVMPGLSGYEVCEALRGDPELAHVPVLLLSGTFETFDEARAQQVGANGHITKPFEAQALVDRVNALLEAGPVAATPAETPEAMPEVALGNSGGSSGQAYDFFDEDMPDLNPEPPATEMSLPPADAPLAEVAPPRPESPMAETALIGADASGDSVSGQVFDLDPLEESSSAALPNSPLPPLPSDAAQAAPPVDRSAEPFSTPGLARESENHEDVFGASFAPEEPVAESSAFSFDESPELAEAVEAFAHPDSADRGGNLGDFDPLTSPLAAEALRGMTDAADDVPDDAVAREVNETFEATVVHDAEASPEAPAAGDDLYEGDFGSSGSAYLYGENDPGHSFADPQDPMPADLSAANEASPAEASFASAAADEPLPPATPVDPILPGGGAPLAQSPMPAASEPEAHWDEDPESLSQSALEPLSEPDLAAAGEPQGPPHAAEIAVDTPAEPAPARVPVEPAPSGESPALPADLQERMHATLERVAWEAMGDLSERVIKETLSRIESIAWEVIPQMAETLIREEIDRLKLADDE